MRTEFFSSFASFRPCRVAGRPRFASAPSTALALALALAALLAAAPARAEEAAEGGEAITASGEVVDLACYLTRGEKGRGPAHAECADMCAKGGAPLGLLSTDGSLLLLVEDHSKPAPYAQIKKMAGKQAEVEGKKFVRGGIPGLMVGSAKEM